MEDVRVRHSALALPPNLDPALPEGIGEHDDPVSGACFGVAHESVHHQGLPTRERMIFWNGFTKFHRLTAAYRDRTTEKQSPWWSGLPKLC